MFNGAMLYAYSNVSTRQLYLFGLLSVCVIAGGGGGMTDACFGMWCGVVSRCVWGVQMGDRHADVWVLFDGACCVEWCTRLLLLLRSCVVSMLFYKLDYI